MAYALVTTGLAVAFGGKLAIVPYLLFVEDAKVKPLAILIGAGWLMFLVGLFAGGAETL